MRSTENLEASGEACAGADGASPVSVGGACGKAVSAGAAGVPIGAASASNGQGNAVGCAGKVAGVLNERLPFRAVGSDFRAVEDPGRDVGGLVDEDLVAEVGEVTLQARVESN